MSISEAFPSAVQSMGRFQVLNHNQLIAPGKCAGCGGVTNRHFIDFGLELDFYGVVYLCLETCFTEVANQIGFISPVQAVEKDLTIRNLKDFTEVLQEKLSALESVRDAIDGYSRVDPFAFAHRSDSGAVHSGSSDARIVPEGHPNPESQGGQSGPDDGEQRSPQSPNESGSDNIRHDDSLDEFAKEFDI